MCAILQLVSAPLNSWLTQQIARKSYSRWGEPNTRTHLLKDNKFTQQQNYFLSKDFVKLLTIKTNGKTRRFDRASVIIK